MMTAMLGPYAKLGGPIDTVLTHSLTCLQRPDEERFWMLVLGSGVGFGSVSQSVGLVWEEK